VIQDLTGKKTHDCIHLFDTLADARAASNRGEIPRLSEEEVQTIAYGWVASDDNGAAHAHFALDRIQASNERAAFMHEVGVHIGSRVT
jgi:hypothetical protein